MPRDCVVKLVQHPVGQGGLMSGQLTVRDNKFNWIYDCGSNQRHSLQRELVRVSENGVIDVAFLSHLDADHVNGMEDLLKLVHVREVVLPYFDQTTLQIMVACLSDSDATNSAIKEFVASPVSWFAERGVTSVRAITAVDSDADIQPFELNSTAGGGDGATRASTGQIPTHHEARWSGNSTLIQSNRSISLQLMGMYSTLDVLDSYWTLAPYAHKPSNSKLAAFILEVEKVFGPNLDLGSIIANSTERKKLRACYDLIWKSHNLISMSLYAGPIRSNQVIVHRVCACCQTAIRRTRNQSPPAWLTTGDMELVGKRLNNFESYYSNLMRWVGTFAIPHHGSKANLDLTLIDRLTAITDYTISYGPNHHGHPDSSIETKLDAKCRAVTDNVISEHQYRVVLR